MKKIIYLLVLVMTLLSGISGWAQTKNFIDQPYIEVTGYADTLIIPNEIYIGILISESDSKNKVPLEETEAKMIEGFQSIGIPTKTDLTVSDMLSNYQSYVLRGKNVVKTKKYLLKVGDAATVGKVFEKLESLGISHVTIEKVDYTDLESIRALCREKAVLNARDKGTTLTKPLRQSIGNAIFISENGNNNALQGKVSGILVRGYSSLREEKYSPPDIDFEKIKVAVSVEVKFNLKQHVF